MTVLALEHFHIRPISEADIEDIVILAGGRRAHPDHHRRKLRGADFLLDDVVIELKALEEDGLDKPERQQRLAAIFREQEPDRPVIVIDRARLPAEAQAVYDRALEGPIRNAVGSARGQLRQSRKELTDTRASVLFVLNNGYTALNHDELKALVANRVRHDSSEIDGVIVGGCYFHSDTFDSFFFWPLQYVAIRVGYAFPAFDALKAAWDGFSEQAMTELMIHGHGVGAVKGPVIDTQFEIDQVTYVKPAPPIGKDSEFFIHGRPRKDSSGLTHCPPVSLTFPKLSAGEWAAFRDALDHPPDLLDSYDAWCRHQIEATESGTPTQPFVPVSVTVDGWTHWRSEDGQPATFDSVVAYANTVFERRLRTLLAEARQRTPKTILPEHYVLAVTEEIGQDKANDVSHIALVRELTNGETRISPVLEDARMFHEYALILACAYAVANDVPAVLWQKDLTYGWS